MARIRLLADDELDAATRERVHAVEAAGAGMPRPCVAWRSISAFSTATTRFITPRTTKDCWSRR